MANIKLNNLSLDYPLYDLDPKLLTRKIISLASAGGINNSNKHSYVRALTNINLNIKAGDRVAIIGGNGAGKTTLLKVIAGIFRPTYGSVTTEGDMTTLLGTGFGFDQEVSGYSNIILGGIALGYTRKYMKQKTAEIEDFTELGNFLNMPLKTYSNGMKTRLAFAIATAVSPEILVIDEGITGGDNAFYEKAQKRLKTFVQQASILLFAAHSKTLVSTFCNKGLYLNSGTIQFFGDIDEAYDIYEADIKGCSE